jgi:hypothetical protein
MTTVPVAPVHFNIEGIGMRVLYINRIEILLKQTVAFQRSAKDMIPGKVSEYFSLKAIDGRYFQEEGCGVGAEALIDFDGVKTEAAISDKQHTTGLQRSVTVQGESTQEGDWFTIAATIQ